MQLLDIEQNSPEWYKARALKMTASNATAIASKGKGLESYITKLVAEYRSSAEPEQYTNEHMQRGHELESEGRYVYQFKTGKKIKQVGFVLIDEHLGCSPDGFVGDDGMIEVKCKADTGYANLLYRGVKGIESSHIWQMQMQMLLAKRKWNDYVAYNPNFKNNMFVHRFEPDEKAQAKLSEGIEAGRKLIKEMLRAVE